MASLKAFLPVLSDIFLETPDALYGRQRALMVLGVIDTKPGRGPGSGAPLTAKNVAALIISLLATRSLSEVDQRVAYLCGGRLDPILRTWPDRDHSKFTFLQAAELALQKREKERSSFPVIRAARTIRATGSWRGQVVGGMAKSPETLDFYSVIEDGKPMRPSAERGPIISTAEIDVPYFEQLVDAVDVALRMSEGDEV